jgi:S-DNA-T family DNA segregation ATPase FtsK/SpoIIIE
MPESAESEEALYQAAKALVLQQRDASVSLVQRHLRLGYARACALFERMEAEEVVVRVCENEKRWALKQANTKS